MKTVNMIRTAACLLLAIFSLAGFSGQLHADERILAFHSDITVHLDGSMTVTEQITVRSEQKQVQRGIYRDFPLRYRDPEGRYYSVDFRMVSAYRDGVAENFFVKPVANGVRIYLGRESVILPKGVYAYEISYQTDRQLGYFGDRDELYWNVTGNGWSFPIEQASATIRLPDSISRQDLRTDFYTGPPGSREKNAQATVSRSGEVNFETTSLLPSGNGLTVVVDWPAGMISRPTPVENAERFLVDNLGTLLLAAGVLLVFLYYVAVWRRVGRDPAPGPVFPRYQPPGRLSPAAVRYVMNMGADSRGFSVAIVNMAVKGYLRIVESDGDYRLDKMPGADDGRLSAGERVAAKELFRGGKTLRLESSNHAHISAAQSAFKKSLKIEYGKGFFDKNRIYFIPGLLLSLVAAIASAAGTAQEPAAVMMLTLWLLPWTAVVSFLVLHRQIFMSVVFGFFEVVACIAFFELVGALHVVLLIGLAVMNLLFFELLKAPTLLGRRLMDEIEGFSLYLRIAESDRLKAMNPSGEAPPGRSMEIFEKYLPYAIALDVEQQWADQFSEILQRAADAGHDYQPRWYHGSNWNLHSPASFGNALSHGFVAAISSAAVAPGSSSGSSGGGFSGGGGGGGGGGGW